MLKFISKFVLNIFPSVAASVIGAYIVNNYIYISAKPAESPSAIAASMFAPKADGTRADNVPSVTPIPVNIKVVEAEAPIAAPERAEPGMVVPASETTTAGRDKRSAVHMRNAHPLARSTGERPSVANRGGRLAETSALSRERVHAGIATTSTARSLPPPNQILMPAVDIVPDEQNREAAAQARIGTAASPTHVGQDRIIPPATELPLMKRLSVFSTDVETTLVSQTQSAADGLVTTAKSVFHAVLPR